MCMSHCRRARVSLAQPSSPAEQSGSERERDMHTRCKSEGEQSRAYSVRMLHNVCRSAQTNIYAKHFSSTPSLKNTRFMIFMSSTIPIRRSLCVRARFVFSFFSRFSLFYGSFTENPHTNTVRLWSWSSVASVDFFLL